VKKAKVDAIVRAKVAEAESRGRQAGVQEGRAREREQFELLLQPSEGDVLIGQRPEYPIINVVMSGARSRVMDLREMSSPHMTTMRTARFRCVREAFAVRDGVTVSWYRWQFDGFN